MSLAFFVVTALTGISAIGPDRTVDVGNGLRCSVAAVGDVDLDAVPDFALARRGPGPEGFGGPQPPVGPGVVWVFSGADGRRLRTIEPPAPCTDFGRAIEDVGDSNGDGHRDLAIAGGNRVWLFSGATGALLHELGPHLVAEGFGDTLAGGRDVDGDGCTDVAVYRSGKHTRRVACVFLFSGRSGELLRVLACEVPTNLLDSEREAVVLVPGTTLAQGIALVPDRDGDKRADIAVAAWPERERPSYGGTAEITIWSSRKWRTLFRCSVPGWPWLVRVLEDVNGDDLAELVVSCPDEFVLVCSGSDGTVLHSQEYGDGYMHSEGTSVDVLGDVDGDGRSDFLVGANETTMDCDPGWVFLHSGADGHELRAFGIPDYDEHDCGVGMDTCAIGDANADGVCDIAVHMPRIHEARVLSGTDFSVITTVDLSDLEPVERR